MYKILNNIIEMDDYSLQRLSKSSSVIEYIWYKLWGNTRQGVLPTGYTQVDYIESTGTQYIDTGYVPNINTKVYCKFSATNVSDNQVILGSRTSGDYATSTNQFYINISINYLYLFSPERQDGSYVRNNVIYERELSTQNTFTTATQNIYLFCLNNAGSIVAQSTSKLYSCKIYDNNTLVRNFIPCYRNNDNEVGLYDLVNDTFYTNQGTGSFTYGSVVPTPSNPVEVNGVGVRTANLWNYTIEQGGWSASAGTIPTKYVPSNTNYLIRCRVSYMMPIPSNTMSLTCSNDIKINFVWIDSNGYSLGGSGWQRNGSTVTAPSNATTLTFILAKVDDTNCTPSDFQNIMLNEGSTAKPYEPYGYKIPIVCDNEIKNIYLNEPLHKIGNYVDILSYSEHNVVRKIKKLVLTGEENVRSAIAITGGVRITVEKVLGALNDSIQARICSHFKSSTNWLEIGAFEFLSTLTGIYMQVPDSMEITTVQDAKQWLATQYANGTPVTIWYVLANEETEQIKAPDILADTYTSITVDTEVQPSQADFTTKGEKVPQLSLATVRKMNAENNSKTNDEEIKSIEELKKELEEPIEKEETIENKK